MAQAIRSVEEACCALESSNRAARERAEETIATLRTTPDLSVMFFIIEHSELESAQYQAIRALWESAILHWRQLPLDQRRDIDASLIQLVLQRTDAAPTLTLMERETCKAVAVITKRKWGEVSEDEQFGMITRLQELCGTRPVLGMNLLQSILSEMGDCSALEEGGGRGERSSLGLPASYHCACHCAFQGSGALLCVARGIAEIAAEAVREAGPILKTALGVILEILLWDFDEEAVVSRFTEKPVGVSKRDNKRSCLKEEADAEEEEDMHAIIKASGVEWDELLVTAPHSMLRIALHVGKNLLTSPARNASEVVSALSVGRILTRLSGLGPSVLKTDEHHVEVLRMVVPDLTRILQGCTPEHVLSVSQIARRVCCHYSLQYFEVDMEASYQFFTALATMTCKVMEEWATGVNDQWYTDAFQHLTTAWCRLIHQGMEMMEHPLVRTFRECSQSMFDAYVQMRLMLARVNSEEEYDPFEDTESPEEELQSIGMLGRMNCRTSVQLVGSLLKERTAKLTEMNVADERALVLLWEELYWLLKICGHLLTEVSDDGEAPSIPYAVNVLAAQDGGAQMLGELFSIISSLVEWEGDVLRNQMSGIGRCLSPLFSNTLVWFLHRWSSTFLFPDPRYTEPSLIKEFGGDSHENGRAVLEFVVRKALVNLSFYRWDEDVCAATAEMLLSLSNHARVFSMASHAESSALICRLPQWEDLLRCFHHNPASEGAEATHSMAMVLPERCKRIMARALVQCSSASSEDDLEMMLRKLQGDAEATFQKITPENASHPIVIAEVSHIIDVSIGAVSAGGFSSRVHNRVWEYCQTILPCSVHLLSIFNRTPVIVLGVLQLFCRVSRSMLGVMDELPMKQFTKCCGDLIGAMAKHSYALNGNVNLESKDDVHTQEMEVEYLLRLLYDASDSLSDTPIVAPAVAYGLEVILPLMAVSPHLLEIPTLSLLLFQIIHNFCIATRLVVALAPNTFTSMLQCLQYGLRSPNGSIEQLSAEAFYLLSRFNFSERAQGHGPGLAPQLQHDPEVHDKMISVMLEHAFTHRISRTCIPIIADCVWFMAAMDKETFGSCCEAAFNELNGAKQKEQFQHSLRAWTEVHEKQSNSLVEARGRFYEMRRVVFWALNNQ